MMRSPSFALDPNSRILADSVCTRRGALAPVIPAPTAPRALGTRPRSESSHRSHYRYPYQATACLARGCSFFWDALNGQMSSGSRPILGTLTRCFWWPVTETPTRININNKKMVFGSVIKNYSDGTSLGGPTMAGRYRQFLFIFSFLGPASS